MLTGSGADKRCWPAGNTVKTAFESVVFLFSIHAFDVGQTLDGLGLTLHGSTVYPLIVVTDCRHLSDSLSMPGIG